MNDIIYEKTFSNKSIFFITTFEGEIELSLKKGYGTTTFVNLNKKEAQELIVKLQKWLIK